MSHHSQSEDDDESNSTQSTQPYLDPRRLGEKNPGLSGADIENVLCILHPISPAAFRAVRLAAKSAPQHVLQHKANAEPSELAEELFGPEDAKTFILGVDDGDDGPPMDLALRFKSSVVKPVLGFCFGRNPRSCDVIFDMDSAKRISNLHFRIFLNDHGVIMLEDMSTNGTVVDGNLLRGKETPGPAMRMLTPNSFIQIWSPKEDETIKFIVRIPTREGHLDEYTANYQTYMLQQRRLTEEYIAKLKERGQVHNDAAGNMPQGVTSARGPIWAPLMTSSYTYGMKWDGGKVYNVTGKLGKGAFATVYRLATAMDGTPYAVKELEKKLFIKDGRMDKKLDNEMRIMKTLEHPNIVQYIDYKEISTHLYIIMEYVPCGDLAHYLAMNTVLPEPEAKLMSSQTLDALAYLHEKSITHRDIKPDNILIASEKPFTVKLSDFGLSKVVSNNETFLRTFCGTLLYCAPEVFPQYQSGAPSSHRHKRRRFEHEPKNRSRFHSYSSSVDVWSFAAVAWVALTGEPPFDAIGGVGGEAMYERIMTTRLNPARLLSRGISPQAADLLLRMLNTDPASRPTERECLQHPWFAGIGQTQDRWIDNKLDDVNEEDEGHLGLGDENAEVQLSQLSIINEEDHEGDHNSEEEEDESPDFVLHPRGNKRARAELPVPRSKLQGHMESADLSPKTSQQRSSVLRDQPFSHAPQHSSEGAKRLFGEIGQSALQSSGLLGQHTSDALNMGASQSKTKESGDFGGLDGCNDEPLTQYEDIDLSSPRSVNGENDAGSRCVRVSATSLGGAESMMREINMDSPTSSNTPTPPPAPAIEPATPKTPDLGQMASSTEHGFQEETPKPSTMLFHRKIDLPGPPSFLDHAEDYIYALHSDADDAPPCPGASADNGKPVRYQQSDDYKFFSEHTDYDLASASAEYKEDLLEKTVEAAAERSAEFLKPAPVFGKLTMIRSTSKMPLLPSVIRIDRRVTTWGRDPKNSHVYPVQGRSPVPRIAWGIQFEGQGVNKAERDGEDWTKCVGIHTVIAPGSTKGVWVNQVKLDRDSEGMMCCKVHNGDEVTLALEEGALVTWALELTFGRGSKERSEGVKPVWQKFPNAST